MSDVFKGPVRPRSKAAYVGVAFSGSRALHQPQSYPGYQKEDNWKLLLNPDGDRIELYDIPNDPMELNNQADYPPGYRQDA